jgi:hypothetical protein
MMRASLPFVLLSAMGCTGNLLEIVPPVEKPHTTTGGGGPYYFKPDIQNDIDKLGCASLSACHSPQSVQSMQMVDTPTNDNDEMANWMAFKMECDMADPPSSLTIVNPSGDPTVTAHPGGVLFSTTSDYYKRWIAWITAGELYSK